MKRIILIAFAGLILLFILLNLRMIGYLAVQGFGQVKTLVDTKKVSVYIDDPSFPIEKKGKLFLIRDLKKFAAKELGLVDNGGYEKMYDQKGEPLLWMFKAAPPYELKPYSWNFPVVGRFSYKSYFRKKAALAEAKRFEKKGYEVWISEVAAWSTLGYFKDPILSSMLERSESSLANLIFHEMTHGTVFIKGNMTFNENLASFVGNKGALYYLEKKYGKNSKEITEYHNRAADSKLLKLHLVDGAARLKALYASFSENMSDEEKKKSKEDLIREIMQEAAKLPYHYPEKYESFADFMPNNAWFTGYLTYNEGFSEFEEEYKEKFNSDLKAMIEYYKEKYGR